MTDFAALDGFECYTSELPVKATPAVIPCDRGESPAFMRARGSSRSLGTTLDKTLRLGNARFGFRRSMPSPRRLWQASRALRPRHPGE
jgi:hypothetical protein